MLGVVSTGWSLRMLCLPTILFHCLLLPLCLRFTSPFNLTLRTLSLCTLHDLPSNLPPSDLLPASVPPLAEQFAQLVQEAMPWLSLLLSTPRLLLLISPLTFFLRLLYLPLTSFPLPLFLNLIFYYFLLF